MFIFCQTPKGLVKSPSSFVTFSYTGSSFQFCNRTNAMCIIHQERIVQTKNLHISGSSPCFFQPFLSSLPLYTPRMLGPEETASLEKDMFCALKLTQTQATHCSATGDQQWKQTNLIRVKPLFSIVVCTITTTTFNTCTHEQKACRPKATCSTNI